MHLWVYRASVLVAGQDGHTKESLGNTHVQELITQSKNIRDKAEKHRWVANSKAKMWEDGQTDCYQTQHKKVTTKVNPSSLIPMKKKKTNDCSPQWSLTHVEWPTVHCLGWGQAGNMFILLDALIFVVSSLFCCCFCSLFVVRMLQLILSPFAW